MPQVTPQDFFTWGSLATLGGAAAATFIISNTMQKVFDFNPRWLALAIAELLSVLVALQAGFSGDRLFISIINGCLIYAAAAGGTSIGNALSRPATTTTDGTRAPKYRVQAKEDKRGFLDGWWINPAEKQL